MWTESFGESHKQNLDRKCSPRAITRCQATGIVTSVIRPRHDPSPTHPRIPMTWRLLLQQRPRIHTGARCIKWLSHPSQNQGSQTSPLHGARPRWHRARYASGCMSMRTRFDKPSKWDCICRSDSYLIDWVSRESKCRNAVPTSQALRSKLREGHNYF